MLLKKKLILKKDKLYFLNKKNTIIFASEFGHVAQLNSALDYGSRGYRFESCHGHK